MRAEILRGYPLEAVTSALGYRRDPADAARWRRPGSVVSINRFMFYDHLRGEGEAGERVQTFSGDSGLIRSD